jgi:hypothetical protein
MIRRPFLGDRPAQVEVTLNAQGLETHPSLLGFDCWGRNPNAESEPSGHSTCSREQTARVIARRNLISSDFDELVAPGTVEGRRHRFVLQSPGPESPAVTSTVNCSSKVGMTLPCSTFVTALLVGFIPAALAWTITSIISSAASVWIQARTSCIVPPGSCSKAFRPGQLFL